ncbi:MAG: CopG family transcriptional regulator [Elusimicrobia bacterium RIFOXYB2_FULL_49_7]|nr:MAG: CopG family transcriptional regulator [Elusimicrobia bacterium RIFOXYB2_FULL_49_7]
MHKTITVRIDDDTYQLFKKAADGSRRTISNFMEYAALNYLTQENSASDREMQEILQDKELTLTLNQGKKEIANRRYKIVG